VDVATPNAATTGAIVFGEPAAGLFLWKFRREARPPRRGEEVAGGAMDATTVAALFLTTAACSTALFLRHVKAPRGARLRYQAEGVLLGVYPRRGELLVRVTRGAPGGQLRLRIAPEAALRLEDAPIALRDLRPGDPVEVVYSRDGGDAIALQVEAWGASVTPARGATPSAR
jgi:hypothetical protein